MWYWFFKVIFAAFFKICFRFRVEGLKNIPKKTNFIIVSNHPSFLDPLCIMAAVPRRIYCIAARHLYRIAVIGWFLRKIGAFPAGGSSLKGAQLLAQNKNVGLFPEGGRSRDGSLGPFKTGVALLAARTGRPVVPCAILGSYAVFPWRAKFPRLFLPISLSIGKPLYFLKELTDEIDGVYLEENTFKIRNTIKEMLYGK